MTDLTRRCSGCAHWKHPRMDTRMTVEYPPYDNGVSDEEYDAAVEVVDEKDKLYGECDAVPMGPVNAATMPLALVLDGSGYFAQLYTLPDFGCALWKEPPLTD